MSKLVPCKMCGNDLSPQAAFCPQCGHPQIKPEPEKARPSGVVDMSGSGLRDLMAVIEQNLEILRELSIHGSGEMKALAIALLQAKRLQVRYNTGLHCSLSDCMHTCTGYRVHECKANRVPGTGYR